MIDNYGLINDRSPHLIADLCEIICYFEDQHVSRADIEMFLSENGGDGLFVDLQVEGLGSAETNERFQELSEEVFRHLVYREKSFGVYYPFSVAGDVLEPTSTVSARQRIYAALLAFSRLKMFSQVHRQSFAADFEAFCLEASHAFTGTWKVVHFGQGGRDRATLGNKLKDALMSLSDILKETPLLDEIARIPDNSLGDAGVDIIIYRRWSDEARAIPAYFAQCAAQQENWPAKKFEANPLNLERYFSFFHKPGTILFIPLCFRGVDGRWINDAGHQTILVDRKRLVDLVEIRIADFSTLEQAVKHIPTPFGLGCATN